MIPKLFHHIWLGDHEFPGQFRTYLESWRRLHPDWEFRFWNNDNLPPLLNQAIFDSTSLLAQKADILRYELLFQFGGIYVDIDFECLKPFDKLVAPADFVFGDQQPNVPNIALLGCEPDHALAKRLVNELPKRFPWRGRILEETGPEFFRRVLMEFLTSRVGERHPDPATGQVAGLLLKGQQETQLLALRKWTIYPYYLNEMWHPTEHPDAYAVHHWNASWLKEISALRRKAIQDRKASEGQ